MRNRFSITTFGLVTLVAASASADPRDPAAAEALFRAGRTAAEKGDYTTACARFEDSRRLDPTLGTAFNLADCDEHIGKYASAWQLFREVAQRLSAGDERINIANKRAAALEPRLPKLMMKATPPLPPRTVLVRDGVDLGGGVFDVALPIDVGEHIVVVKSPGRADKQYTVTAVEGQISELSLEAGAVVQESAVPAHSPNRSAELGSSGAGGRTAGVVLLGVGTAGLVTGTIAGAIVFNAKKTVDAGCDAEKRCSPDAVDAGNRGHTASTVSTIAFGAGLAAMVAGLYLVLSHGSADSKTTEAPTVGMAILPGRAFVTVEGRLW